MVESGTLELGKRRFRSGDEKGCENQEGWKRDEGGRVLLVAH
jgi:hypothetical protein